MRATNFEFRNRFWFFSFIFGGSFWLYALDHVNATNALAGWLARWDRLSDGANTNLILWLGAAFGICSVLVRMWATAYLRTDVMQDANLRSERVVADGPYRHVRNPLYLGNDLLALAMAPLASRLGAVTLIMLVPLFNLRLILREEAELDASQGESYRRFKAAVPRLIPTMKAKLPASGACPRWKQALIGESFTTAFALAVVMFAISKDQRFLWGTVAVGFAAAGVSRFFIKPATGTANKQSA